jgi:allantoicase
MGDGWETKRSRTPGHNDFVIIKLCVCLRLSLRLRALAAN